MLATARGTDPAMHPSVNQAGKQVGTKKTNLSGDRKAINSESKLVWISRKRFMTTQQERQEDYGTDGKNGRDGKFPGLFPVIPFFPSVP